MRTTQQVPAMRGNDTYREVCHKAFHKYKNDRKGTRTNRRAVIVTTFVVGIYLTKGLLLLWAGLAIMAAIALARCSNTIRTIAILAVAFIAASNLYANFAG